jgi:hypothetical protein
MCDGPATRSGRTRAIHPSFEAARYALHDLHPPHRLKQAGKPCDGSRPAATVLFQEPTDAVVKTRNEAHAEDYWASLRGRLFGLFRKKMARGFAEGRTERSRIACGELDSRPNAFVTTLKRTAGSAE